MGLLYFYLFKEIAYFLRQVISSSVACPALPYFSTSSHKQQDIQEKITEHEMRVLNFSTTFLILRIIQHDTVINVHMCSSSCKVPVILVRF
jgi:hypothetical protein